MTTIATHHQGEFARPHGLAESEWMYEDGVRHTTSELYRDNPNNERYAEFLDNALKASDPDIICLWGNDSRDVFRERYGEGDRVFLHGRWCEVAEPNHPEHLQRWLNTDHAEANLAVFLRLKSLGVKINVDRVLKVLSQRLTEGDLYDDDGTLIGAV